MIPSGWMEVKLGDVTEIVRGSSPRPKGDPRYYGGTVPRLMVEDITRDGKYVTPRVDFLTEAGAKLSRPMKKGDLVVVCSGTVGVPSLLAVDACIHDGFLGFRKIDNSIYKEFLYYLFLSLRSKFESSATHGGIFTNLTTTGVKDLLFTLPPKNEQEKIAKILSTWDEAIQINQNILHRQQLMKRVVGQRLLSSENIAPLKEFLSSKIQYGANAKAVPFVPNRNIRYIRITDISETGSLLNSDIKGISSEDAGGLILDVGDILLARSGNTVGKSYHHHDSTIKAAFAGYLLRVKVDQSKLTSRFLFQYLQSDAFKNWVNSNIRAGAQPNINADEYSNLPIPVLKLEDQNKIVSILESMDKVNQLLKAKSENLVAQKHGLMQQLLSGKRRVKV